MEVGLLFSNCFSMICFYISWSNSPREKINRLKFINSVRMSRVPTALYISLYNLCWTTDVSVRILLCALLFTVYRRRSLLTKRRTLLTGSVYCLPHLLHCVQRSNLHVNIKSTRGDFYASLASVPSIGTVESNID